MGSIEADKAWDIVGQFKILFGLAIELARVWPTMTTISSTATLGL